MGISVAGHVTKGQTDEEAIHRELQEELGIRIPFTFVKKIIVEEVRETERVAVYKGVSNGPFTPNEEEVTEVRFFDIRQLRFDIASRKILLTVGAQKTLQETGVLI